MQVGTHLRTLLTAADEAARAERLGYDDVATAETDVDPFVPLVAAADRTERVRLTTAIAVAFARSPMTTAMTAHNISQLAPGRVELGLGSQVKAHITRRFGMEWSKPAARMRDYVRALHAIWDAWESGERLAYRGEFYEHTLMTPVFTPPPAPRPAILVAGVGELMTKVAGEAADGFLCHPFTTPEWVRDATIPALRAGAERGGRSLPAGYTLVGAPFVVTGDDQEMTEGMTQARQRVAFYASTPAYRPVLEHHGWGELGDELHTLSVQGRWEEMGRLVDGEVSDAFITAAPPEGIVAAIGERWGGLASRIAVSAPASLDDDAAAQLVADLAALPAWDATA